MCTKDRTYRKHNFIITVLCSIVSFAVVLSVVRFPAMIFWSTLAQEQGVVTYVKTLSAIVDMTSLRPLSQLKKSGRVTYGKSKGIIHPEDCGPYTCVLMQSITRYEIGDLLERLGYTGQGAEVGIFEGTSTMEWLKRWKSGGTFFAIDPYIGTHSDGVMIQPTWTTLKFSTQADLFAQVGAKFRQNFASRVVQLRKTSDEINSQNIRKGSLDFCYIDGLHEYEPVLRDLEKFVPLVRSGGIVGGHDYSYGQVRVALKDYLRRNLFLQDITLFITDEHPPSFFFINP